MEEKVKEKEKGRGRGRGRGSFNWEEISCDYGGKSREVLVKLNHALSLSLSPFSFLNRIFAHFSDIPLLM
jgi:hypothetical protein